MTPKDCRLVVKAAALLECFAGDIYASNSVDGEWAPGSERDKREHKDLIETASRLRVLAKGAAQ